METSGKSCSLNGSTRPLIEFLSPPGLCQHFHPVNCPLENGFVLEVFQELIAIWIVGTRKDFGKVSILVPANPDARGPLIRDGKKS